MAITAAALEFLFLFTAYRAWKTHDGRRRRDVASWKPAIPRADEL